MPLWAFALVSYLAIILFSQVPFYLKVLVAFLAVLASSLIFKAIIYANKNL